MRVESSDDVFGLLGVTQGIGHQVPVVNDEGQVVLQFYLVCHFVSLLESVAHDGDQHVQHVDQKDELSDDV